MLLSPIAFVLALFIVGAKVLLRKRWPRLLFSQAQSQQAKTTEPSDSRIKSNIKSTNNGIGPKSPGLAKKQVHFAEVLTSSARFNPNAYAQAKKANKQQRRIERRRHNSEGDNGSTHTFDQLLRTIEASNISKQEVEVALEALLTKVKSNEAQWSLLKSDPLAWLKGRSRETEASQLESLKVQLQGERDTRKSLEGRVRTLEEDKSTCSKELSDLTLESVKQKDQINELRVELEQTTRTSDHRERENQALSENIVKLESDLQNTKLRLEQMRASKQSNGDRLRTRIAELESDLASLEAKSKEQEIVIKRLSDEKQTKETVMKQTLSEMELELRDLQEQLNSKMAVSEQRLAVIMKQLQEGLSELFPDLKTSDESTRSVEQYLLALKQLATTVEELRLKNRSNNNNNNNSITKNNHNIDTNHSTIIENSCDCSSPGRRLIGVDKSTWTVYTKGNTSRVGSPTSDGRSSRASSNRDYDTKKLMETRLVEDLALFCLRCLD